MRFRLPDGDLALAVLLTYLIFGVILLLTLDQIGFQ